MPEKTIHILLIEEHPGNARWIAEYLGPSGPNRFDIALVAGIDEAIRRLDRDAPDLLLLDLALLHGPGSGDFEKIQAIAPGIPIVLLGDLDDETTAIEAIQNGAQDYLIKNQLNRGLLEHCLRRAVERKRAQETIRPGLASQEAINSLIADSYAAKDLPQLLKNSLKHILSAMDLEQGAIWLADGACTVRGLPLDQDSTLLNTIAEAYLGLSEAIAVPDWNQRLDGGSQALAPLMHHLGIRASINAPLMLEKKAMGGMLIASPKPRIWSSEEVALVEALGRGLGHAAERLALFHENQEQVRQLRGTLDAVQEGILTLEADGHILLTNPAARELLSLLGEVREGDILGRLGGQAMRELLSTRRNGLPHEVILEGEPKRIFEICPHPAPGLGDQVWTFLLREATEAREVLLRAQEQEHLAALGRLAAGIAHDFNNSLAITILYGELLYRSPGLPPKDKARLGAIIEQAQRAASLARQVLDFSRQGIMSRRPMDLVPFFNELKQLFERTLPENILLHLTYEGQAFNVYADPAFLQQVFMNLALNARDAMPQGGQLRIEVSSQRVEPDEAPDHRKPPPGEWIRVQVADTGTGIPSEVIPHVFEPFFTTKSPGQGTGLGLAQAYGIIKQLEGYIDVVSQEGRGSTFTIYLPRLTEPLAPIIAEETTQRRSGGGTILVAEDDQDTRRGIAEVLRSLGYEVLVASDGLGAYEILQHQSEKLDLLLSDMIMPGLGSMELYNHLRSIESPIPMLVMTGYPLTSEMRQLLKKRDVDWIQKPFSMGTLAEKVEKAMTHRREDWDPSSDSHISIEK